MVDSSSRVTPEEQFGATVERARTDREWSQEYLASISNLSRRTISRVERGASAAPKTRERLEIALELPSSGGYHASADVPPRLAALGRLLREIRRSQNLTLKAAAGGLQISLSQLSRLERGIAVPRELFDVGEGADIELRPNAWRSLYYKAHLDLIADVACGDGPSVGAFRRI
jgi:transcriptional regulator with XRE-family HTH domain